VALGTFEGKILRKIYGSSKERAAKEVLVAETSMDGWSRGGFKVNEN
jgi:hypothetical protein